MCGRYQRRSDKQKIAEAFHLGNVDGLALEFAPDYNAAPQSMQPVIVWDEQFGTRSLHMMFWRFLPPYVTDPKKFRLDTINAKGETLLDSNTWRYAFLHSCCLVPVDSFIEWKRIDPKTKLPWMFAMKDDEPFALAGVYRRWRSRDHKSEMDTFAVITTEPNELLAGKTGHDRMPVIIKPSDYARWLAPGSEEQPPIDLIRPFDSDKMKAWRVDRRINNVRINEPSLDQPIKEDFPILEKRKRAESRSASQRQMKTDSSGCLDEQAISKQIECHRQWSVMVIASWNVNSLRARVDQVTAWLNAHNPDVLLLQELKGTEFPTDLFKALGYESAAVTQKAYNGVAVLSRYPLEVINTTLLGDEADSHARFLEVIVKDIRIANIYLPNGNPVGSDKFAYKLAWMDRLGRQLALWLQSDVPTVVGGDFNVIPENIDCHKPASWTHDALFQPEPREWYRAFLGLGYIDAFRFLHPGEGGQFTFWDYFRQAFEHNRGIRIDHFLLSPQLSSRLKNCEIDKAPRAQVKPSDHTPIVLQLQS